MIIVLTICVAVLIVAVVVLAGLVVVQRPTNSADDLQRYEENLERLVAAYSDQLTKMADRKVDEMGLLLRSAHGDRERLITALLAFTNPQVAVTVGRIDQATARTAESLTMHDFMEQTRETETRDGEGKPIIPVGMG